MSNLIPGDDRRNELQADRALFGLSPDEQRELAGLVGVSRGGPMQADVPDEFELAAAALDLAMHGKVEHALPSHLRDRILKAEMPVAPTSGQVTLGSSTPQSRGHSITRRELAAWMVAAASLFIAAHLGTRTTATANAPAAATLRDELLAKRGNGRAVQVAWTRGEDESAANAEGDVVWSDADRSGVMRFRGLAVNNPTEAQYQLWIFDAERDDAHPVDGGVFDIPTGGGDILVPITAKLPVSHAKMFAITVERPGGVVVSDRSRLPLLAQVP